MDELKVFWTRGFVVVTTLLICVVALCICIPDPSESTGSRRRRCVAAAAAVELHDISSEIDIVPLRP
jgi:hypothetical protein